MAEPTQLPDWIRNHLKRYRETNGADGHLWKPPTGGDPVPTLLLTTTGRKSKKRLEMPLIYGKTKTGYAIVASKGGAPAHPAWFLNLQDDPNVEVQVAAERFPARARVTSGAERAQIWQQMAAIWPSYEDYQRSTTREIPVVVLERR
jgi:deazaflavin-dependent oxidoreductase (nitroreductase family)